MKKKVTYILIITIMENSFFEDLLMLIGILPIERPCTMVKSKSRVKNFLRVLSDEERQENKIATKKLFQLTKN